jgi:modification methylase ecoRV
VLLYGWLIGSISFIYKLNIKCMVIPPIKSQGIKSKLVPCILDLVNSTGLDLASVNWIEPFFGTGVVGFNVPVGGKYIVGDSNPHIINFYKRTFVHIWSMRVICYHCQVRMVMLIIGRFVIDSIRSTIHLIFFFFLVHVSMV